MSAIQVTCPGCKIALRFATAPTPGSKFKCSNCKATITIGTPKPRKSALATMPAAPPQAGSSAIANRPAPPPMPMPPASLLPSAMTPTPPPMPALPAQPFAPNPYPRQGQGNRQPVRKAGTSTGLIVGLIGGGIAVVAGVVVTLILVLKPGKNTDQARADEPPAQTQANDDAPKPKGESKSFLPPFGKPDPKPEKKDDTKPISKPEQKPDPKPEQKPDSKPDPKSDPKPRGNGSLTADVLRKIKMATVYIRITEGNGQKASGSGFYESSSSMVLTNAHVVGMLKVESPPPKKIEVVLLSGEKGEVTVPGKIIAVDRTSDLCVLDVPVPDQLKATLVPLTVSPAKDLLETQEVFIAGFPLGEGLGKNITISKSSVSSMRKARDGMLDQIQVNGGMHPGNSGGPVVDGDGNVVGVAVAGIEGTTINFAIPGEFVQSVLRGRLASINTANEATKRDGKYVVGIRVSTLDPLKKVKKISIDYWTGPPLAKSVPASDTQPVLGPDCTPRKTVEVAYKPEAMSGEASMVLDDMPAKGKVLFIQPVFVGETGQPRWVASVTHTLAAPVEAKPAMLATQFYPGKGTLQLKSTAKYKRSFGSRDESFLATIDGRFGESTLSLLANGAKIQLSVQRLGTAVSVNNKAQETTPEFKKAVSKDVGGLLIDLELDKSGDIISKRNVLDRIPRESRDILDGLGDQVQASFDMVAIPLPGVMTTPGTQWKARRAMPIDGLPLPRAQTAMMDMTYTYRGTRMKDGKEVAVIDLRGSLLTAGKRDIDITLRGQTTGTAEVDPAIGVVISAKATADATISARLSPRQSVSMKGTLEVTMTRQPPPINPSDIKPPPPPPPPVVETPPEKVPTDTPKTGVGAATLEGDKVVRPLPSTCADAVVGGGGRYLILHLPQLRKLAIFDVTAAKIVDYIALSGDNVKFAAGLEKVVVVYPDEAIIQSWDLATRKRELTLPIATRAKVDQIALGSASRGPVCVACADDRAGDLFFLDLATLKGSPIRIDNPRRMMRHKGEPVRASSDGQTFGFFMPNTSPQSVQTLTIQGNIAKASGNGDSVGHVVPGPDGRTIFTARGLYTTEAKRIGQDERSSPYCLPAVQGPFYLAVNPGGGPRREKPSTALKLLGDDRPLATLTDLELPQINQWDREAFGTDRRIHFIPDAKVIVIIPATNDKLSVHKCDIDALLAKSGIDYLFVTSQPPQIAKKGKTLTYQIDVKSKKGGPTFKLESGPKGMEVSATGLVKWTVPSSTIDQDISVVLSVGDAGGQNVFHTFTLRVQP